MQALEWIAFDRIRQFETQLEKIKSADFIHGSTQAALCVIEETMRSIAQDVTEAALLPDSQYLVQKVVSVNQKLFSYTNYLGILLRSTNVRNCYEAYYALSQIVTQLTARTNQLIVSSEWDASPFFIQNPPEVLRNFVFIGIPAFASRNALLLPLAAHEIGHAIWRLRDVEGLVYTTADLILNDYIENNRDSLIPNPGLFKDIDQEQLHARIMKIIMSQSQEIFCDLFGAFLFKKSFFYAFEQYLFPGFGRREPAYPSFEARINYVRKAAFEGFETAIPAISTGYPQARAAISPDLVAADAISEKLHKGISEVIKNILSEASLLDYSTDEEDAVAACLRSKVPPQMIASPVVILNAIWTVYRQEIAEIDGLIKKNGFTDLMNNLCMKSLEISEFLQLGDR